jgi:hypothetical protein
MGHMGSPELHATSDQEAGAFYSAVMRALKAGDIPFLVGGTYAVERHTGFSRGTKDLDLFVHGEDWSRIGSFLRNAGIRAELVFSHWLGKAFESGRNVDLIFAGGNGLVRVDSEWFRHGLEAEVCGEPVLLCPAEEMIWSKAFVMERERFDGADVVHMLKAGGRFLDWERLLRRFGQHWRVLLAHLLLFGFVYPQERDSVPSSVLERLQDRLRREPPARDEARVCRGTLLSRSQYLVDVTQWGYADARLEPGGSMTADQIERWTEAGHETLPSASHDTEAEETGPWP